jgi:hypothetical protein
MRDNTSNGSTFPEVFLSRKANSMLLIKIHTDKPASHEPLAAELKFRRDFAVKKQNSHQTPGVFALLHTQPIVPVPITLSSTFPLFCFVSSLPLPQG